MTIKPVVVVSDCLLDRECRYNGEAIRDPIAGKLHPFVTFVRVCPEVAIGLGIPRDPIRLVESGTKVSLVQPATDRDVTARMRRFARSFVRGLPEVDGFLLKGRSPSCGVRDAKAFPSTDAKMMKRKRPGLFAEEVLRRFPASAVEDEGRLRNFLIREHFLTRLFTAARFRGLRKSPTPAKLVRFHARHKLLLMAHREASMRTLGRIVANPERRELSALLDDYERELGRALERPWRPGPLVNVWEHAFGYVSKELRPAERRHFRDLLGRYRRGRLPASAVTTLLRSWILRYDVTYLEDQVVFEPFPPELMDITDSGKGRDA